MAAASPEGPAPTIITSRTGMSLILLHDLSAAESGPLSEIARGSVERLLKSQQEDRDENTQTTRDGGRRRTDACRRDAGAPGDGSGTSTAKRLSRPRRGAESDTGRARRRRGARHDERQD